MLSTLEKNVKLQHKICLSWYKISSLSIYLIQADTGSPAHSHGRVRADMLPILRKLAFKRV